MSVERNLKMDNAKGILIMLVVIGHFLLPLQGRDRFCTNLFYEIYVFHMAAFSFISGLFSGNIYRGNKKKCFNYRQLLKTVWLYVIYKIIVFFSEIPAYGCTKEWPDFFHEEGAPWYLLALSIWYIFIPLLTFFKDCVIRSIPVLLSAIVALSLAGGYIRGLGDILSLERIIAFAPFFYSGHFLGIDRLNSFLHGEISKKSKVIWCIIEALAVFFIIYIAVFMYDRLLPYHDAVFGLWYERFKTYEYPDSYNGLFGKLWVLRFIWYVAAASITLFFLRIVPDCNVPVLTVMGQRTLQIYILHRPVRDLLLASGFIKSFDPGKKTDIILVLIFCIFLSILLSMKVFTKIFKLFLLPFDFEKNK